MQWTFENYKYYSAEHLQKAEKYRLGMQIQREAAALRERFRRKKNHQKSAH